MSEPPQGPDGGEPQYPVDPYAQGAYPPAAYGPGGYPAPAPSGLRLTERLGARLVRRPEPRFGVSLAAAGAALAVAGVLIWSIGYLGSGLHISFDESSGPNTSGDSHRFLGAGFALVLVVVGYALVVRYRTGPLATAGVVASIAGVPLMILFVSFDLGDLFAGGWPFSIDAVYLVSILAWLISYFAIPGARGRSIYLGLAATGLASYIGVKAAGDSLFRVAASSATGGGLPGGGSTDSIAGVGLVFGLIYYCIAAFLDKRGRSGAAIGLVYAGFATTVGGVLGAIPSFGQVGTGVLLIVLGAGLSWYGGYFARRFTTWVWMGALTLGVILLAARIVPHSYTGAGILLIVVGAALAFGAARYTSAINEAPDIVEAPAPAG
jgi:hypothetical protein